MVEAQFFDSYNELSGATPLRRFWGTVAAVEPKSEGDRTSVQLQFTDVEIVPYLQNHPKYPGMAGSVTTYIYAVAELDIPYRPLPRSGRPSQNSSWGLFMKSVRDMGLEPARSMPGKRVLMEADPDHEFSPARDATDTREAQERVAGMVWSVVEVKTGTQSSVSNNGKSDTEQLLEMLNGHTRSEFNRTVLQSAVGRKHEDAIMDGSLLQSLVELGRVKMEGDKYIVVS